MNTEGIYFFNLIYIKCGILFFWTAATKLVCGLHSFTYENYRYYIVTITDVSEFFSLFPLASEVTTKLKPFSVRIRIYTLLGNLREVTVIASWETLSTNCTHPVQLGYIACRCFCLSTRGRCPPDYLLPCVHRE